MKKLLLKFACFVIGYNYDIVKNSSEVSIRQVKKFLSAIIIISILWAFIGFVLVSRYFHGTTLVSILGAVIMLIIVIQIERQITLSVGKSLSAKWFRIIIGIVMAVIGSVILDQVMFKEDVEKKQIGNIEAEISRILPIKTKELTEQLKQLDLTINDKEEERRKVIEEVSRQPMISSISSTTQSVNDTTSKKFVQTQKTTTVVSIPNPKAELIPQIDAQLKKQRELKAEKENDKLNIQQVLEKELKSKTGFLDELNVLFSILLDSGIALIVWIFVFIFFLSLELFVLVGKYSDKKSDYDTITIHQMEIRKQMLQRIIDQRQYNDTSL